MKSYILQHQIWSSSIYLLIYIYDYDTLFKEMDNKELIIVKSSYLFNCIVFYVIRLRSY